MEYASGGELFDHILAHRYLKEKDACKLFAQLISGVSYIHSKKIVHRDLKLENLLLDRSRNVIITDFGFANRFEHRADDLMQTSCGSPCYAAPELVISEGLYVGSAVDIWSCGVILYAMLAGYLPYDDDPANPEGDNINLLYKYIVNTPLTFPDYISADARDLLSQMLVPDPKHRASLESIKKHRWLESYGHLFERSTAELERIAVEQQNLKRQAYQRQMRAAAQQSQTKEYLYDSSTVSAPTPRRAVASAIVMGSNPEPEPFVDSVTLTDTLSPTTSTSEHDRSSTRSKRSKSKEKRAKTPDKDRDAGSRRKKTGQRHTLQLEYAEDVPASPPQVQVPSPPRPQQIVTDFSLTGVSPEASAITPQQPSVQPDDEPSTPKAKTVPLEASAQASPKTPTAAHPMPSSFEAIFTPPSQHVQQQQQQHESPQANSDQQLPSHDSVARVSQSPQTTPRKSKGGDAASTNSGGSSSKRHRRGLSMDKFGFSVGKKASDGGASTGGEAVSRNGVTSEDTSASHSIEKDSLKVNGNDTKGEKDVEQEKDDKKTKNRRKTLSLMVEPLSRLVASLGAFYLYFLNGFPI